MFQDFCLFVLVLNNIENIEKCTVSFPIYLIYTFLSLPLFLIHFSFSFFCILSHATFLFSFYVNHFYLIFLFHSIFSTFLLSFPSCLSLALNIFFKSCSLLTSHAFFTMPTLLSTYIYITHKKLGISLHSSLRFHSFLHSPFPLILLFFLFLFQLLSFLLHFPFFSLRVPRTLLFLFFSISQ